jgi:hypothetical protein
MCLSLGAQFLHPICGYSGPFSPEVFVTAIDRRRLSAFGLWCRLPITSKKELPTLTILAAAQVREASIVV